AHLAKRREPVLELRQLVEVKSEDVRLYLAFDGAELDARDDSHAELRAGGTRFGQPRDRIVIGEGECGESSRARSRDHISGRLRAVGRRRVRVEIDKLEARGTGRNGIGHEG